MTQDQTANQSVLPGMGDFVPQFGEGFLQDHAGKIITDPKIALVELVANCWDAGADKVSITWPEEMGKMLKISDNGTGISYDEFRHRWLQLNYNRVHEQGVDVEFPPDNNSSNRKAFGRNGKGRHAMFCFSNSYSVETKKGGEKSTFEVKKSLDFFAPFHVNPIARINQKGHGTTISSKLLF